jgi:hypothetical protein
MKPVKRFLHFASLLAFLLNLSLLVGLSLLTGLGSAQTAQAQIFDRAPNVVYGELLGNSGGVSLNYERALAGPLGLRVGASYMPGFIDTPNALAAPVMVNLVLGSGKHKAEVAFGPLFRYSVERRQEGVA